jgi:hypothetical protein
VTKLEPPINSLQEWAQVKNAKLVIIDRSEPYIQTLMVRKKLMKLKLTAG